MAGLHFVDRIAVRREIPVEAERFPREVVDQLDARGGWGPVDLVVGAHDRARMALGDDAGELRGVVLAQRPLVHVRTAGPAVVLAVVGGEVLQGGDGLVVAVRRLRELPVLVLALQAVDVLRGQVGGEDRVLAPALVVAAPARVAGQVHGRRVEVEVLGITGRDLARLRADLASLLVHQIRIPRAAHGQVRRVGRRVRQGRRVAGRGDRRGVHPMIGLVPPAPRGHAQARDRGCLAAVHLRGLLRRGHPGDQVGGAFGRAVGPVQVDRHRAGVRARDRAGVRHGRRPGTRRNRGHERRRREPGEDEGKRWQVRPFR